MQTPFGQSDDQRRRTFSNSISICFRRYAKFSGRAPRAEFWYFALFIWIISVVLEIISSIGGVGGGIAGLLYFVSVLVFLLPSLSVHVRRLHDLDRSGWWLLLWLVPVIGAIVVLIWDCTRGTRGPNRFGADPLGAV